MSIQTVDMYKYVYSHVATTRVRIYICYAKTPLV